jgi:hypothetical protein
MSLAFSSAAAMRGANLKVILILPLGEPAWSSPFLSILFMHTGTGGESWLAETGIATTNEASLDHIAVTPSRISSNSIVSKQLVAQSQPHIEAIPD